MFLVLFPLDQEGRVVFMACFTQPTLCGEAGKVSGVRPKTLIRNSVPEYRWLHVSSPFDPCCREASASHADMPSAVAGDLEPDGQLNASKL